MKVKALVERAFGREALRVKAPGARGRFGLRSTASYARNPLRWLRTLRDEYGDIVEAEMLGRKWFVVSHPDDIEKVLVKHAKVMNRDAYIHILQRTLGLGLLTSEGELWKRQRKLMAQAFTPRRIQSYAETMSAVTDRGVHWAEGSVIDLHAEMSRVTMEVVAAVLFGAGIGAEEVRVVSEAMEVVNGFYANSLEAILEVPEWVPTPRNRELSVAVKRIDAVLYDIIAERRRSGAKHDDLLGTLLAAVDDDGSAMTDQQLRDEAITLFLAGHETTALTLGYTLMLLGKYPEVEQRLKAELDSVLGGRLPTADDTRALPYTRQVLEEAMRLYPPAWTTGRESREPIELRGFTIPAGSQILTSQWVVHRDPRFFPDPEAFDPDRFEKGRAKQLPKYAYFPFGGGPRVCIGNHFAMMEAILILAIVMQRHHFELLPDQPLDLAPSVTLRPAKGVRAVVKHRPGRPRVAEAAE
ncbi:MAG: cytochrome P450 [Sandaracinus sp.]|nr:cytochrome P450 [Sandaracinus sp.]|tara:strand:+ start:1352 stop:2758 length:1407 start_codon:yes stop_codon:yes gene_type:complete